MNRKQAEHILDAYLSTYCAVKDDGIHPDMDAEKARDSLREVILDAMTEYRSSGITVSPGITWPSTKPWTVPTYHQPIVTCKTEVDARTSSSTNGGE